MNEGTTTAREILAEIPKKTSCHSDTAFANTAASNAPYDSSMPFEVLIDQVEESVFFSAFAFKGVNARRVVSHAE